MVTVIEVLAQFSAVLTATLIGVYSAFLLDRWQQERENRNRTAEHLRSLKSEIELNTERVESNAKIVNHLRSQPIEGEHYILNPLETDAWLAALEEPILGTISNDLYRELQDTYSAIKLVNSLIERQKSELHHRLLGAEDEEGRSRREIWTIRVEYFDVEEDEIEYTGLGPLIETKSERLREKDELIQGIENEIKRLEEYSLKQHITGTLSREQ